MINLIIITFIIIDGGITILLAATFVSGVSNKEFNTIMYYGTIASIIIGLLISLFLYWLPYFGLYDLGMNIISSVENYQGFYKNN